MHLGLISSFSFLVPQLKCLSEQPIISAYTPNAQDRMGCRVIQQGHLSGFT